MSDFRMYNEHGILSENTHSLNISNGRISWTSHEKEYDIDIEKVHSLIIGHHENIPNQAKNKNAKQLITIVTHETTHEQYVFHDTFDERRSILDFTAQLNKELNESNKKLSVSQNQQQCNWESQKNFTIKVQDNDKSNNFAVEERSTTEILNAITCDVKQLAQILANTTKYNTELIQELLEWKQKMSMIENQELEYVNEIQILKQKFLEEKERRTCIEEIYKQKIDFEEVQIQKLYEKSQKEIVQESEDDEYDEEEYIEEEIEQQSEQQKEEQIKEEKRVHFSERMEEKIDVQNNNLNNGKEEESDDDITEISEDQKLSKMECIDNDTRTDQLFEELTAVNIKLQHLHEKRGGSDVFDKEEEYEHENKQKDTMCMSAFVHGRKTKHLVQICICKSGILVDQKLFPFAKILDISESDDALFHDVQNSKQCLVIFSKMGTLQLEIFTIDDYQLLVKSIAREVLRRNYYFQQKTK